MVTYLSLSCVSTVKALMLIHIPYTCFTYEFFITSHCTKILFYSYMFRLTVVAIIRESLFSDVQRVQYVNQWQFTAVILYTIYIKLLVLYSGYCYK
jgi:hypothetical protein